MLSEDSGYALADQLHLEVISSESLSHERKADIIAMCNRAYEEDLEPLFNTFGTATHVLGDCDGVLVSHAMWVTRWLQAGMNPMMRTAYIEMVATDEAYRKRGFATAVMQRAASEIQNFELGGLLETPSDEEVMILRLPHTPALDLNDSLSAEWRDGELW